MKKNLFDDCEVNRKVDISDSSYRRAGASAICIMNNTGARAQKEVAGLSRAYGRRDFIAHAVLLRYALSGHRQ